MVRRTLEWSTPLKLIASVALAGCAAEFTPYNEIDRFRVLAIAATPPDLRPGESTSLTALTASQAPVEHRWSWCPFSLGPSAGYECAFTREQLQAAVDETSGAGAVRIPPLDLGDTATVTFAYQLPSSFFRGVCALVRGGDLPESVSLPRCDERFPITIRLEARSAETTIVAVKNIRLLYRSEDIPNRNPAIGGITAERDADGTDDTASQTVFPAVLDRETPYQLRAVVTATDAETHTSSTGVVDREALTLTWFVRGGELESTRTAFVPERTTIERAGMNVWTTPKSVDYAESVADVYVVIRDDRGGTAWIRRGAMFGE